MACLGVDHAVLAANDAGTCDVCHALPKELKISRMKRVRELFEREEALRQRGADVQQEGGEELPEEESEPAGAQSSRSPPAREEDEEEEYEPEFHHGDCGQRYESHRDYDDGGYAEAFYCEEEEYFYNKYPPQMAAEIMEALARERELQAQQKDTVQPADPSPVPAAAEAAAVPPPPRPELPQLVCDESDPVDIFKNAAACSGVRWPVSVAPREEFADSLYMAFGDVEEPKQEKLVLPIAPDFYKVFEKAWKNPSEDLVTPVLKKFRTDGAKEAGLTAIPPMDRRVAEHLLGKKFSSNKEPVLDGTHAQDVSKLVKAAYSSSGSAAEAANAVSMLQFATHSLLHDMGEAPTKEQILMLRRLQRDQMAYTAHIVATTGRAMARLVQVERSRWLVLSTEHKDKEGSINQEVRPGSLLSMTIPEMVAKHEREKAEQEALKALIPVTYPKSSFTRKPSFGASYGAYRGGGSWGRGRSGPPRAGFPKAPKPGPAADQQQHQGGKRPEKRRWEQPEPSPAFRGRGRGRGTRGASARGSAK